jgi:hypothetical protein
MRHAACHFSIAPLTRGKTASAVARAAYIARCRLHDERTGQTFVYSRRGGLLTQGVVNWATSVEQLWNEVERSENRKNSRVAREIKVALPAELPLDEMRRAVHGFCCHLKDRYGLAAQWVIHAPRFHDEADGRQVERCYREGTIDSESYWKILLDPKRTNRNFHAHILKTTRSKDPDNDGFAEKIRCLDSVRTGPEEFQALRGEWELRANAALKRVGANVRVDLRSNNAMAAAHDAPDGLITQPHVGPKANHGAASCCGRLVKARKEIQEHNSEQWVAWEQRRALERERARLKESERIAVEREVARKIEAAAEKRRIAEASTELEAQEAARNAVHISSPRGGYAEVIAKAQNRENMEMPPGEDIEIDPETYECETSNTPFQKAIKVRRRALVRSRVRN